MKILYAALCVLGLVVPYYFFLPFLWSHGLDIGLILNQLFANPISAFFGVDVIVSSLVLWLFIYHETRKRAIKLWWLAIVANLVVGVSLGFPLFLFLREIEIEREQRRQASTLTALSSEQSVK